MSDKKVIVTITSGCRAAGKSLTRDKAYSLSVEDAKLVVSAGRGVYGDTTKKPATAKQEKGGK
tara:strand:+ start:1330 stop:1518 length:189 start_codon:yes stop_codon:yes gene_type:complete